MRLEDVFVAAVLVVLLIAAGKSIRNHVRVLRRLYLPSSLIGGVLALLVGPQTLGWVIQRLADDDAPLASGIWPERVLDVWSAAPALLISVVFAGLFLGKQIPKPRQIWKRAGPMVMHGQTLAWGQYVVGITLTIVLLSPVWGVSPLAGALIEIGFEGGHGTAAGLSGSFADLGFADGADLALGMATVGVVMGVFIGTMLINWGVARGHIPKPDADDPDDEDESNQRSDHDAREKTRVPSRLRDRAVDSLSIHLGLFGAAISIGWLLLEAMTRLEAALLVPLGWPELMKHIPLFPLAMIGGVVVQVSAARAGWSRRIDRKLINRVSGASLDVLIVAAMATLSLGALGEHIWVFVLLCAAGIAWNVFGLLVLAPRMFPENWMQNGMANFGQGMGMTVVGLLLVRMSDPDNKTNAMDAFGYKQLLFEPVVGGGLFTAASLPLIAEFGPVPVLIGVGVLMAGWLTAGLLTASRASRRSDADDDSSD
ncbi:MAG: sodium:glutamate symporter [Phycisphaerales bacterium]|nr:MAG: sodium:glutamate symporter [Phycisphaerales bacterium]